jgi:hypothetical protein
MGQERIEMSSRAIALVVDGYRDRVDDGSRRMIADASSAMILKARTNAIAQGQNADADVICYLDICRIIGQCVFASVTNDRIDGIQKLIVAMSDGAPSH